MDADANRRHGAGDAWLELLLPGPERSADRARARGLIERLEAWVLPRPSSAIDAAGAADVERLRDELAAADRRAVAAAVARLVDAACAGALAAGPDAPSWTFERGPLDLGVLDPGCPELGSLDPDSCAPDICAPDAAAAARALESLRAVLDGVPAGPLPGESSARLVPRLLGHLRRESRAAGGTRARSAVARRGLHAVWALRGPERALARWQRLVTRSGNLRALDPRTRALALVDGIELCLATGRVRRALTLSRAHPTERAIAPRLVWLAVWCELAAGDPAEARAWSLELEHRPALASDSAGLAGPGGPGGLAVPSAVLRLARRAPWCARALEEIAVRAGAAGEVVRDASARSGASSASPAGAALAPARRSIRAAALVVADETCGGFVARAHWTAVEPGSDQAADDGAAERAAARLPSADRGAPIAATAAEFGRAAGVESVTDPAPWGLPASTGAPHGLIEAALVCGAPQVRVLEPGERAAHPAAAPAVAAVPLPADGPRGAVWFAFDHRLAPSDAELRALAAERLAHWRSEESDRARARRPSGAEAHAAVRTDAARTDAAETVAERCAAEPRAGGGVRAELRALQHGVDAAQVRAPGDEALRCAEALVERLGVERRRWWLFVDERPRSRVRSLVVVRGPHAPGPDPFAGDRLPYAELETGAVAQTFATSAARLVERLEPGEGVAPDSRCGAYLPLFAGPAGCGVAVLALESPRRGAFDADTVLGLARRVRDDGTQALLAAACDGWGRRSGEAPVAAAFALDPASRARLHRTVLGLDACVGIVGPPGSGKRLLARCVHELRGAPTPLRELRPNEDAARFAERYLDAPPDGTFVAHAPDRAPGRAEALARLVARRAPEPAPLLVWTATSGCPADGAADGAANAAAAQLESPCAELGPVLRLAPLTADRSRLVAVADQLVARIARRSGRAVPALEEPARAALWRGPWPGGVAQLERCLERLVARTPRARIGLPALERVAFELDLALPTRVPSRRPPRALLEQAIRTTALKGGRANQRRAALYLGWDRDTVRARLREAGLL